MEFLYVIRKYGACGILFFVKCVQGTAIEEVEPVVLYCSCKMFFLPIFDRNLSFTSKF